MELQKIRKIGDYYPLYDGHGSIIALSDSDGAITDTYNYTPNGKIRNLTGATINPYQYSGERTDSETGFQYLRARYYDVEVGRFTTRDTWAGVDANPVTLNKYLYGNGNPVRYVDRSGRFPTLTEIGVTLQVLSVLSSWWMQPFTLYLGALALDGLPEDALSRIMNPDASFIGANGNLGVGFLNGVVGADLLFPTAKPSSIYGYAYLGVSTNIIPKLGPNELYSLNWYAGWVYDIDNEAGEGKGYAGSGFSISVSLSILKRFKKFNRLIGKIPFNASIFSAKRGGNGKSGAWGWTLSGSKGINISSTDTLFNGGRENSFISFGYAHYWGPEIFVMKNSVLSMIKSLASYF